MKTITVALAGNPNTGKTTIFNSLTGGKQHVGNYPGVTVEKKTGFRKFKGYKIKFIDLPGTYGLSANSEDERVARDFLIKESPDLVVNVLDSTNLERNLYLTLEIIELGLPMVLALNMSDSLRKKGIKIDNDLLAQLLRMPVVSTTGGNLEDIENLLEVIIDKISKPQQNIEINYQKYLEQEIASIKEILKQDTSIHSRQREAGVGDQIENNLRWMAIKLLENDSQVMNRISNESRSKVLEISKKIEDKLKEYPEVIIAEKRYGFISGIYKETVKTSLQARLSFSDRIDDVVTNRFLGLPIFLGLMGLVFYLVFFIGDIPMGWMETFFSWLSVKVSSLWVEGSQSGLRSLLVDGIIGGVGGVIVFLPNIFLLFFSIAMLEATGYMARAAFVMDKIMHKVGLHGRSFIPMLSGFGCSVPAIMATRTLDNRRDRLTTMMIIPLMSCGARLPIYTLIIPAFFTNKITSGLVLMSIYLIGIVLAIIVAKVLRLTALKGENVPFVMELPPYRLPSAKSILIQMWEKSYLYLKKAGTVILVISIAMWFLTNYPQKKSTDNLVKIKSDKIEKVSEKQILKKMNERKSEAIAYSIAGRIGHFIEPVLKPMGFDWRIGTALIGAFAAKEVFVSQMGIVFRVGEVDENSKPLRSKLKSAYTPLIGFCIMLFVLIASPCMATVAITKKESGSWKWAFFQFGYLTTLAYIITVIVYQLGKILGG